MSDRAPANADDVLEAIRDWLMADVVARFRAERGDAEPAAMIEEAERVDRLKTRAVAALDAYTEGRRGGRGGEDR